MFVDRRLFDAMDLGSDGMTYAALGLVERGRITIEAACEQLEAMDNLGASLALQAMSENLLKQ